MTSGSTLGLADGATDPLTTSLNRAIEAAAHEMGLRTRLVGGPADEAGVDILLSVGLPQYYATLLESPRRARRIAWFGEPLPRPPAAGRRGWILGGRPAGSALRGLRTIRRPMRRLRGLPLPGPLATLRAAAYVESERRANLAAAVRCAAAVDLVVVTSRDRAVTLAASGVAARVTPFGYHPLLAGAIVGHAGDRDIPVVALGSGIDWASRRARALRRIAVDLGPVPLAIAGPTWGSERANLLGRSRILLDVHRVPGNFIGLRVLLAAAAGAVLVTEPMDDPHPFQPGTHFIQAPLADLATAARDLLADEPRRRRIVGASQALISGPLSMSAALQAVLA